MAKPTPIPSARELFGVNDAPRNARDRLLQTAVDLFYVHGINSVGLDQVIAAAGVTKTTFYKHFESKDDLIVEAIRMRDEWEMRAWERAVIHVAGRHPRDQLLGYFDVLDIWFNDADFGGCMFINAAAEFPNPHDPIHETAAEHKRQSRQVILELAEGAGLDDPTTFADQYTMMLEGALILRQVHGRNDAAKIARPVVERLIDQHTPAR